MGRTETRSKRKKPVKGREEVPFEFQAVLQPPNGEPPFVSLASKDHRVRLRFESPEQIAQTMIGLMEASRLVWPDHPLVQEYAIPDPE